MHKKLKKLFEIKHIISYFLLKKSELVRKKLFTSYIAIFIRKLLLVHNKALITNLYPFFHLKMEICYNACFYRDYNKNFKDQAI